MAFVTATPPLVRAWTSTRVTSCRTRRARTATTLPLRMVETGEESVGKTATTTTPTNDVETPTLSQAAASSPTNTETETKSEGTVPFELRGFSLANVFLFGGLAITIASFSEFFGSAGTAGFSSLGFVYGVPIALVGAALKYAELQPVKLESDAKARKARDEIATDTQKQIISDVTRHRYGDESHMQPALSALGLIARGQPCPKLITAKEKLTKEGEYALELYFISLNTPYARWEEQIPKYEQFFGPNIMAETKKIDQDRRIVRLRLTSVSK